MELGSSVNRIWNEFWERPRHPLTEQQVAAAQKLHIKGLDVYQGRERRSGIKVPDTLLASYGGRHLGVFYGHKFEADKEALKDPKAREVVEKIISKMYN